MKVLVGTTLDMHDGTAHEFDIKEAYVRFMDEDDNRLIDFRLVDNETIDVNGLYSVQLLPLASNHFEIKIRKPRQRVRIKK